MTVNIFIPDDRNCYCAVFLYVYHGSAIVMMVIFTPPLEMVPLLLVVSLLLILVPTLLLV